MGKKKTSKPKDFDVDFADWDIKDLDWSIKDLDWNIKDFDLDLVPKKDFLIEKNAKNKAYMFIVTMGLFDEFKKFDNNTSDNDVEDWQKGIRFIAKLCGRIPNTKKAKIKPNTEHDSKE